MRKHILIVGGGAAGLMAALFAARGGAKVTLLERNEKLGKKIYITGKGRCNLTNACGQDEFMRHILRNPRFLYAALATLDNFGTMELMESLGLTLKTERGERVFPTSDKASDVTGTLARELARLGVTVRLNARVSRLLTEGGRAVGVLLENGEALKAYYADLTARIDTSAMEPDKVLRCAAVTMATKQLMLENNCSVGAMECWSATPIIGVPICMTLGELADAGLPISCETDLNGAVTLAILRAVTLGEASGFLADLTIRHPENDNAELLWHCGPFPYSLKDPASKARLVNGQERWELKKGEITISRFDDIDGEYYLFGGEGKAVDGPETTGTYVWFEADNWKRWEEKLMFGPYIHHVGGVYGNYKKVLREAARYLGMKFDDASEQGVYSL